MALEGEAPAAIDGENVVGLLEKKSAQQRAAARPDGSGERIRQLHQRAGQDVGDDEVVRQACLQLVVAQADGMDEAAEVADAVQRGVLAARPRRLRHRCRRRSPAAATAWPWRWPECRCRSRHRRRWPSRRDRASPAFSGSRASWRACRCRTPCPDRCAAAAGRPACRRHCARDGPRTGRRRTAGTSAGSRRPSRCRAASPSVHDGSVSPRACAAARIASATCRSSVSPNTSMRHGPSRETSQLVTTKPASVSRSSSALSHAARSLAGATKLALATIAQAAR